MKKLEGLNLIRELTALFGPSGCEDAVRDFIAAQIEGDCDGYCIDKAGNLIAKICGRGMDYEQAENPRRILLSAHMDEVGFMITEITEEGYLRFGPVGGIDPRVLPGRHVRVGKTPMQGVIASKAIHMQTAEERTKVIPVRQLYMDIGAKDKADAESMVSVGDWGVFDSDFVSLGKDNAMMKAKALDDRVGCALLIEVMRDLKSRPCDRPFDLYFAFTCCEEVGISGASVAAFGVSPELAIVLESTAIHDLPNVPERSRVGKVGAGGALSLADNGTIYDRAFVDYALRTAADKEIPVQVKQAVSGGNDAAHIQKSMSGVRVLALSLPTRYIHSASNVACYADYESMRALLLAMLREWKLD